MRTFDRVEIARIHAGAGENDQGGGDRHVHQRAGDGDQEFLVRLFRDALEASDSADRQERDVGRRHAERSRREGVAKFMRHDAREQEHQESETLPSRLRSARHPARGEDPAQKQ